MRDDPPGPGAAPLRILVREVNWLGDAVMSTPALQRLRERHPQAHIALLCPQKLADLWMHFPWVNEVVTVRLDETPWSVGRRLRGSGFDTALVFPNSPRSALETWFARIPRCIGYDRPWRHWLLTQPVARRSNRPVMSKKSSREIHDLIKRSQPLAGPIGRFLHPRDSTSHQLNEYLHLVSQLGADPAPIAPSLDVDESEISAAASKFGLDHSELAGKPILTLNPGAEYGPAKRWPVDNFVATAAEIQKRTGCVCLILGAKSDTPLANELHSALRTPHSPLDRSALKNLAGRTSLRELMALLKMTRVLLTNDTGPMHVAAALGTPVVVPFGSTSPELTGPGLPGDSRHHLLMSSVPCAPCFRRTCPIDFRCMKGISVEWMVATVLEAFAIPPDAFNARNNANRNLNRGSCPER
jgi:lipopolysaccharide heptosyltransferase II